MAREYDGRQLIKILKKYLKSGSSVLEIGMGPGKDLDLLREEYKVTGSDSSRIFLDLYRNNNPDIELIQLDAVTLITERTFDAIYSNKVLQHLTTDELKRSVLKQFELLHDDGIIFHSFWKGDKEESFHGLRFVYYTSDKLRILFSPQFDILEITEYKEVKKGDSIYLIARKKS